MQAGGGGWAEEDGCAVDGNYTIYSTSTGLVEVYERAGWSRAWGRRCFRRLPPGLAYETLAGVSSLIISPVRVVTDRGAGRGLQTFPGQGEGARCVHVSNKGVIYATYQRQFYVKLISPSPFEEWIAVYSAAGPERGSCLWLRLARGLSASRASAWSWLGAVAR
jgi:hypothetical protein